jgi:hypothetical protein
MEILFTEANEDSPSILFDGDKGFLEIKGRSLPEDANVCYRQLHQMVKEYVKTPQPHTCISFRMEYLNSSSTKKILEIITLFEPLPKIGHSVEIKWFYNADDEDMLEEGEEFIRMTDLPISLEKEI